MKKTRPPRRPRAVRLEEDVTLLLESVAKVLANTKKLLRILQPVNREDVRIMLALTPTQQAILAITDILPKGAKFDGVPEWSTSDAAIASIEPDAKGLSAVVKAAGIGTALITFTGDKKQGAAVSAYVATLDVQVQPVDVESAVITAGTPTEQA